MMAAEDVIAAKPQIADVGAYYVRVLGVRSNRFVEFEFAIDDPEQLMVELIMPFQAFEDFCRTYRAVRLPPRAGDVEKTEASDLHPAPDAHALAWGERGDDETSQGESR